MSLIPTHRPVIGEDLDALREQLGLSTMDGCWLYGMSMNKWTKTVKKEAREVVENASLALLARELSSNPALCPVPRMPTANEILELIKAHQPSVDKKRLAIMFGCEASSGYRWITIGSKISPVLSRLFLVFRTILQASLKRSDSQALSTLADWDRMVALEAMQRGVSDVFSSGRWTVKDQSQIQRPILGQDLDELREELGLSTMDACWLYGMSMTKWSKVINKEGRKPVPNTSLALLVRALRAHPQACPVPRMVGANEVFEQVKSVERMAAGGHKPLVIDKKRLAIMFGCEASSGYRWITIGSKISPVLARLFTVFKERHCEALIKARSDAARGRKNKSFDTADNAMLNEWDRMVLSEAEVRGIVHIFSIGRWVPYEMLTDKDKAEAAREEGVVRGQAASVNEQAKDRAEVV